MHYFFYDKNLLKKFSFHLFFVELSVKQSKRLFEIKKYDFSLDKKP
jgi:hypothetical protein